MKELLETFLPHFYKPYGLSEDGIMIGSLSYHECPEGWIKFFTHWTKYVDQHKKELNNKQSIIRFFSFEEYAVCFQKNLPEQRFKQYPALRSLCLFSQQQLEAFTASYEYNEEHYLYIISQIFLPAITTWFEETPFLRRLPVKLNLAGKHCLITGTTGSGKSHLLKLLMYDAIHKSMENRNTAIILIEPKGDLTKAVKKYSLFGQRQLGKNARKRVAYVAPDLGKKKAPTINVLDLYPENKEQLDIYATEVTSTLVKLFEKKGDTGDTSSQMIYMLKPAVSTLIWAQRFNKGRTYDLKDLLHFVRPGFFQKGVEELDPHAQHLRSLVQHNPIELQRIIIEKDYSKPHYVASRNGLTNRLGEILQAVLIDTITRGKNTVKVDEIIRRGQVGLFDFNRSNSSPRDREIIGQLIIAQLQAALAINDRKQNRTKKVLLIIDEFQAYATPSLISMLREYRSLGLSVVLATQHLDSSMPTALKEAIEHNCAVKISGMNSIKTQSAMAKEMDIATKKLQQLRNFEFRCSVMGYTPFKFKTLNALTNEKSIHYLNKQEENNLNLYLLNDSKLYRDKQEIRPPNRLTPRIPVSTNDNPTTLPETPKPHKETQEIQSREEAIEAEIKEMREGTNPEDQQPETIHADNRDEFTKHHIPTRF